MLKKNVLVMFGGVSAEHEVSIISGIQVLEAIDREKYNPLAIYVDKKGIFKYLPNFKTRKDFSKKDMVISGIIKNEKGTYLTPFGLFQKAVLIDAVFMAFHGGLGENGAMQGLLEQYGLPFTSPSCESSALAMNKQITDDVLTSKGVNTLHGISFMDYTINEKLDFAVRSVEKAYSYPVIVKPVHLGSSIGFTVAHNQIELEKGLMAGAQMDTEVMVENFLENKSEYNISVKSINGKIEFSEIERPISKSEALTFEEKYSEGGAKKTGGMASSARELPAKISDELKSQIEQNARNAYIGLRCSGTVRIDFIYNERVGLKLLEVNPIPGSLSFFLWEAKGISFKEQISEAIEEAIKVAQQKKNKRLDYQTDIVEKFIALPVK